MQAATLNWILPIRDSTEEVVVVETVDETATEAPLVLEEVVVVQETLDLEVEVAVEETLDLEEVVAVEEIFQPLMDPNSVEDALARTTTTLTTTTIIIIGTTIGIIIIKIIVEAIIIAEAIIIVEATNKTSQWVVLLQGNDPV